MDASDVFTPEVVVLADWAMSAVVNDFPFLLFLRASTMTLGMYDRSLLSEPNWGIGKGQHQHRDS